MGQRAAKRYATALIHLAQSENSMDKILEQTQMIKQCIFENSELRSVLNSPVIKNVDKLSIAKSVFKTSDKMLFKLFETLSENNRFDHLKWICQSYARQYNVIHHISEVDIYSAVELDDKIVNTFKAKIKDITSNESNITTTVNKDLLGGFILNVNGLQHDASILGHLNKLKKNLYN